MKENVRLFIDEDGDVYTTKRLYNAYDDINIVEIGHRIDKYEECVGFTVANAPTIIRHIADMAGLNVTIEKDN